MTVKQEQEQSMTRRQHFVVIVRHYLFDPFSSFHGSLQYHKIKTKLSYYIRIADFYHIKITVVKIIEDCLKTLILRLCFCFLRLQFVAEFVAPVSNFICV